MSVIVEGNSSRVLVPAHRPGLPAAQQRKIVYCPVCKRPRAVTRAHKERVETEPHNHPHGFRCRPCAEEAKVARLDGERVNDPTKCQHCKTGKITRPRFLCWHCYYKPGVKDLYPSQSKYARRGVGNFTGYAPLPEPTTAMPGTAAKVAVMELRAKLKQQLFHPDDEAADDETARELIDPNTVGRRGQEEHDDDGVPRVYVCALPLRSVQWNPGGGD